MLVKLKTYRLKKEKRAKDGLVTGQANLCESQMINFDLPLWWHRYMTESDNYHGGTFTRRIAALSAAPCNSWDTLYNVNGLSNGIFLQE